MARYGPHDLRKFLLDEELPGVVYVFIWGDLEEDSEARKALSAVLFDQDSVEDADDAPVRDLSDIKVRAGVVECVMRYPEVQAAAVRLMRKFKPPWWKFW